MPNLINAEYVQGVAAKVVELGRGNATVVHGLHMHNCFTQQKGLRFIFMVQAVTL